MPVAQPGHCALIWRGSDGEWQLENDCGGWGQSTMHTGIQRTWENLCCEQAGLIPIMEKAQSMHSRYVASELLRLMALLPEVVHLRGGDSCEQQTELLADAIEQCHYNLSAWVSLMDCISGCKQVDMTVALLLSRVEALRAETAGQPLDLARFRPVEASEQERACNVVDGTSSEWFPTSESHQWLEVDLEGVCQIDEVKVQWWGDYGSKTCLKVLSRGPHGKLCARGVRENDVGLNGWSTWAGWKEPTCVLRLELGNPCPDCFGLDKRYGLRQLQVIGHRCIDSAEELRPHALVVCWAEYAFRTSGNAEIQALRFVREKALAASQATSVLRPLRPLQGGGCDIWLTAGTPSLAKLTGRYYYELRLGRGLGDPQIGWVTASFEQQDQCTGDGVGDDENGWGADGLRHCCWIGGHRQELKWPEAWSEGNVVGCAVNLDAGEMSFSCDGCWHPLASLQFNSKGRPLYPAFSLRGDFTLALDSTSWCFTPPHDGYVQWSSADVDGGGAAGLPRPRG